MEKQMISTLQEAGQIDLQLYGRLCSRRPVPSERMDIPGQISAMESQLLYYLLAEEWTGGNTVAEIGTLFGASTQMIGLGMLANPRREGARLFAIDAFGPYFDTDEFARQLNPLLGERGDWSEIVQNYAADGFEAAYRAIHEQRPYAPLHEIRQVLIPGGPDESVERLRRVLQECGEIGLAFIDSAKTWYPLRTLAAALCDHLADGALVLWQDYRWFNSYSIAVFNAIFAEHFELLTVIDNTHVYRYAGGLTTATVLDRMPPRCTDLGLHEIERILRDAMAPAIYRNDFYGLLSSVLQLAYAAADCGEPDRGREILANLRSVPGFDVLQNFYDLAEKEIAALVER